MIILMTLNTFSETLFITLRKKRLYSEFFWLVFSHIRTEYGEIRSISPNVGKYGPEKL